MRQVSKEMATSVHVSNQSVVPLSLIQSNFNNCFLLAIPPSNPCAPSPCNENADCVNQNGQAICTCRSGFFGNGLECESKSHGFFTENYCSKIQMDHKYDFHYAVAMISILKVFFLISVLINWLKFT